MKTAPTGRTVLVVHDEHISENLSELIMKVNKNQASLQDKLESHVANYSSFFYVYQKNKRSE